MSIRKIAGLLAASGLVVGLIGTGVGAQFTGQVSAQQNLNVGTFGCAITSASPGTTLLNDKTVYYDAGTIASSNASSMPLSFTVSSTGTIPVVLNISATTVPSPFHDMLTPTTPVTLAAGGSQVYTAGISWPELNNSNLGQSASVAYVVNCNEENVTPATVSFSAVMGSPYMNDTITGAGFLPNVPVSVLMYRFGSSTPFDLAANGYGASTIGNGSFVDNYQDDCHATPINGAAVTVDMPVVVWASDGTRSAIGTGIIPCSLYH